MDIIDVKKVDDCLEGKDVRDLLFDKDTTKEFVDYLSNLGKMIYHDFKPKPFWNLIVRGRYTLKGAVGNNTARLLLPDENDSEIICELKDYISGI